jgi:Ni,Fe-hydrogenase III large subunit
MISAEIDEHAAAAERVLPGEAPVRLAEVTQAQLIRACATVRDGGGLLHTLWASPTEPTGSQRLYVALQDGAGLLLLAHTLDGGHPAPDLAPIFPAANRLQRALRDLSGVGIAAADQRPWLRHTQWPAGFHPLQAGSGDGPRTSMAADPYAFVEVRGEGVHEIAVGPVHAGTIEPGHFRFSVVGEKVLRLEERLGYKHKGIERRFTEIPLDQGHRLAARVSGDSAVAYGWAYCMALESLGGVLPPPRAQWLRALLLERERIANHLGDLGALGNDAGFGFGLSQFSRLKEMWLRDNAAAFGARYPFDVVAPGGVARDLPDDARIALLAALAPLEREVAQLRAIYDDHAGVQDRFLNCGRVEPELAARLGLIGLAGRASSQLWDRRCDHPHAPYDVLDVQMSHHRNGDVAARVAVRFDEVLESLRLCRRLLEALPPGPVRSVLPPAATDRPGVGWIEGWRGPVLIALEAAADNRIRRCHPHDPSWQNWPVLEHAVIGNIVPDFPLINKSFNLSYAGVDL